MSQKPLELETRWPDALDIEEPDTSETYPGGASEDDGGEIFTPQLAAALAAQGFNVDRLRQAWGDGSKLQ